MINQLLHSFITRLFCSFDVFLVDGHWELGQCAGRSCTQKGDLIGFLDRNRLNYLSVNFIVNGPLTIVDMVGHRVSIENWIVIDNQLFKTFYRLHIDFLLKLSAIPFVKAGRKFTAAAEKRLACGQFLFNFLTRFQKNVEMLFFEEPELFFVFHRAIA